MNSIHNPHLDYKKKIYHPLCKQNKQSIFFLVLTQETFLFDGSDVVRATHVPVWSTTQNNSDIIAFICIFRFSQSARFFDIEWSETSSPVDQLE